MEPNIVIAVRAHLKRALVAEWVQCEQSEQ